MKVVCPECGKLVDKHGLSRHKLSVHEKQKNFVCNICGVGFAVKYKLREHLVKHSDIRNFPCAVCGSTFKTRSDMIQHERRHKEADAFHCYECTSQFPSRPELDSHMKNQHKTKTSELSLDWSSLTCPVCNKNFSRRYDAQRHFRTMHGQISLLDEFSCSECNQKCTSHSELSIHLREAHPKAICKLCNKGFSRTDHLKRHMDTVHVAHRDFKCTLCNKAYKIKQELAFHVKEVHDRLHKCDECNYTNGRPHRLLQHKLTMHSKDSIPKLYECDICGKTNENKNSFRYHVLRHIKKTEQMKECDLCKTQFNSNSNLKRHKQRVHGKIYECDICGRLEDQRCIFRAHVLSHMKKKENVCNICKKHFKRNYHLKRHRQRVHGIMKEVEEIKTKVPEKKEQNESIDPQWPVTIDKIKEELDDGVAIDSSIKEQNQAVKIKAEPLDVIKLEDNFISVASMEVQDDDHWDNDSVGFVDENIDASNGESPKVVTISPKKESVTPQKKTSNFEKIVLRKESSSNTTSDVPLENITKSPIRPSNLTTSVILSNVSSRKTASISPEDIFTTPAKKPSCESSSIPPENVITTPAKETFCSTTTDHPNDTVNISTNNSPTPEVTDTSPSNNPEILAPSNGSSVNQSEKSSNVIVKIVAKFAEPTYHCKDCKIAFTGDFNHHFLTKHPTVAEKIINRTKNRNPSSFEDCVLCLRSFASRSLLVGHYKSMHPAEANYEILKLGEDINNIQCMLCKKYYSSRRNFLIHLRKMHPGQEGQGLKNEMLQRNYIKQKGPLSCDRCGKQYKNKILMICHLNTHFPGLLKSYVCEICGMFTRHASKYYTHMNEHNNIRNFKCKYCNAAFSARGQLNSHILAKHKEFSPLAELIPCKVCGKKYSRMYMHQHKNIHLNVHKCKICGRQCATETSLAEHSKTHPEYEGRIFPCESCGKRFSLLRLLKSHIRKAHPEETL